MDIVPNRIFCIPEIEDMIFNHLDPVRDLKNVTCISHHYYTIINNHSLYAKLRNFCKRREADLKQRLWRINDFNRACLLGKLEICEYIYHTYSYDIDMEGKLALQWSCYSNHLEIAIWLTNIAPSRPGDTDYDWAFHWSCLGNYLEIAIWSINSFSNINICAFNDRIFRESCQNNHIEIALWLVSICNRYQLTLSNDDKIIPIII